MVTRWEADRIGVWRLAPFKIWDLVTGQCKTVNGHSGSVKSVAWSPDGKQIASASDDCTVKIWDPATGQCKATLEIYTASPSFYNISLLKY